MYMHPNKIKILHAVFGVGRNIEVIPGSFYIFVYYNKAHLV